MFSTFPNTNFDFSVTFILPSASCFNLDQSKNLLFGKGLKNPLTHDKILALSKWKTFEDYNSIVAQMVQWVENIVGKGENAGNQHFLLFLQWSKRTFSLGCQKFSSYGYGLRHGKFVVCKCLILCLSHLVKN